MAFGSKKQTVKINTQTHTHRYKTVRVVSTHRRAYIYIYMYASSLPLLLLSSMGKKVNCPGTLKINSKQAKIPRYKCHKKIHLH